MTWTLGRGGFPATLAAAALTLAVAGETAGAAGLSLTFEPGALPMSSVVQHPFADTKNMPSDLAKLVPADATRSSVGFIGPFPALSN